jgi:hypothetical protein
MLRNGFAVLHGVSALRVLSAELAARAWRDRGTAGRPTLRPEAKRKAPCAAKSNSSHVSAKTLT